MGGGPVLAEREKGGEFAEETAARETEEEANGLLGTRSELQERLRGGDVCGIAASRSGTYLSYLLRIEYDANLPAEFERATAEGFNGKPGSQGGLYEKDLVAWYEVTASRRIACILRPFYGPIMQLHITTLLALQGRS